MSVVNCRRVEVVECSALKTCWSGAGRRYLLIVGRIRVSMISVAGQRSEMCPYEIHWEVSLLGFGIGIIKDDLHIAGIWHVVTQRRSVILNRSRSEMLLVEDAEFIGAKCLTISTALHCSHY